MGSDTSSKVGGGAKKNLAKKVGGEGFAKSSIALQKSGGHGPQAPLHQKPCVRGRSLFEGDSQCHQ